MTNTVAASNRAWFYGYAALLLLALGVVLVAADGETNENEGGKGVEKYRPPRPCKTNKGTLNTHSFIRYHHFFAACPYGERVVYCPDSVSKCEPSCADPSGSRCKYESSYGLCGPKIAYVCLCNYGLIRQTNDPHSQCVHTCPAPPTTTPTPPPQSEPIYFVNKWFQANENATGNNISRELRNLKKN